MHPNVLSQGPWVCHAPQHQNTQTKGGKGSAFYGQPHDDPRYGLAGAASLSEEAEGEEVSFLSFLSLS
ncbi:MAG: hypothetical protein ACKO57_01785, partial [Alphaproteobacteria bacterium]